MQGTYANKNHFAGVLEMVLPLAIMYGVALLKGRLSDGAPSKLPFIKAAAALLSATLIFFGLLYSMSKMGFVSGLCALVILGSFALRRARIQLWKKVWQ